MAISLNKTTYLWGESTYTKELAKVVTDGLVNAVCCVWLTSSFSE